MHAGLNTVVNRFGDSKELYSEGLENIVLELFAKAGDQERPYGDEIWTLAREKIRAFIATGKLADFILRADDYVDLDIVGMQILFDVFLDIDHPAYGTARETRRQLIRDGTFVKLIKKDKDDLNRRERYRLAWALLLGEIYDLTDPYVEEARKQVQELMEKGWMEIELKRIVYVHYPNVHDILLNFLNIALLEEVFMNDPVTKVTETLVQEGLILGYALAKSDLPLEAKEARRLLETIAKSETHPAQKYAAQQLALLDRTPGSCSGVFKLGIKISHFWEE
jgi:hypothetical protein